MNGLTPERYEKLPKYAQAELNRLWILDQRRAEVLGAWERWEAKLILEDKANALEFMSNELYEEMLVLQIQRNEAFATAEGCE